MSTNKVAETSDTDIRSLEDILREAPFGITVIAEDGIPVFANTHAQSNGGGENQGLETREFLVHSGPANYVVSLSLDESERHKVERELVERAYFDELTGLPNRVLMERSVTSLMSAGSTPFALAFFDLDNFKQVNDYYGHATGDALLAKVAERLGNHLRASDMLARLSGDEFALLIAPIGELSELAAGIDALGERLKEPFYLEGSEVFTSASVGVSLYPRDGESYEALRGNADRAMYRSKTDAKGTVYFYDSTIEHAAAEKARLEQRLRLVIRDKRVRCAYQPKVDLRSGEISGVEVLMRWRDEDGTIQPPGEFLGLAVELGLMDDLTHFIFSETARSIDVINEAFGAHVSISVNVAARQASDFVFMQSLVDTIQESGFAERIMLEITEEAFLSKAEFQDRVLPMIRASGVRVSIDDFGIGYSSLSALADITADEVKVDRSFITDIHKRPRSQSILKAIEALGRSLGMSIVVEGVETFEELAYLQTATRIACAQGYYFSQPMLLEDLRNAAELPRDARTLMPTRAAHTERTTTQRVRTG